jgi:hypothetical protein
MKIDGGGHSGYIRVEGDADPEKTAVCHCTDCQVGNGSAFRVNVPVPGATFRITGIRTTPDRIRSTPDLRHRKLRVHHLRLEACASAFNFVRDVQPTSIATRILRRGGDAGTRLDAHGRVPKSATSDGDKAKGPAVPVAVFGVVLPWQ